ncbi:MAG: helix-turn-helix domain-containing protein [Planctomycetota bacterium]|jgi:DNA-binding XRE family transcriptional regulator
MHLTNELSEASILEELGARLGRRRLDLGWAQAELASRAGVSKRTIERIEAGASTQLGNWIRVLRAMDLIEAMEGWLPGVGPRPMEMLRKGRQERRRVSPRRRGSEGSGSPQEPWSWGDEA